MTGKRSIVLFWILLLIPTVILAAVGIWLLSHEQERLERRELTALTRQVRATADKIDLSIETVQNNLSSALVTLPETDLESRLLSWEAENPLIRNVFIYDQQLIYPQKSMAATAEERGFITRFEMFFSGQKEFVSTLPVAETAPAKSAIEGLYSLSRAPQTKSALSQRGGWIPWFSNNRLYVLGWVQKHPNEPVYGVELELMAVLSRLLPQFPPYEEQGAIVALLDGSGNYLIGSGPLPTDDSRRADVEVSLSTHLPHWTLVGYRGTNTFGGQNSFMPFALVLLGLLVATIVLGGAIITRFSVNRMKDARQKTSFVASVSHELKTPLTSIRMYAELLHSKRVKDPEKQQRYLDIIVSESGRLTRLINNILDFSRIEQGKKSYSITTFTLDDLLAGVLQTHAIRIRTAGFSVNTEGLPGDYQVNSDREALEQVLLNLIDNALKYATGGSLLKFIFKQNGSTCLLTVEDDGPGIPGAEQQRIFDRFYRIDTSLTAPQPGSGLGLSIARKMLRDLNGELSLEEKATSGAAFTMRIPTDGKD